MRFLGKATHTLALVKESSIARGAPAEVALAQCLRSEAAGSANAALAMATVLSTLWNRLHSFDAADPAWPDRDRFVLCPANAGGLLRAMLRLSGYAEADGGHAAGVRAGVSAGAQALGTAVGMALAERSMAARFGKSLVDHRVWAVCDLGDLSQGLSHEVTAVAGQLRLDRLALLLDATGTDEAGEGRAGGAEAGEAEDVRARFAALGWASKAVDAEDVAEIEAALSFAARSRKPTLVVCTAGRERQPDRATHSGATQSGTAQAGARELWRRLGARGATTRRSWLKRIARHPQRAEFERALAGRLPENWQEVIGAAKHACRTGCALASSAELSHRMMLGLAAVMPELVSARLAGEAGDGLPPIVAGQFGGQSLRFARRAHGMAACAMGMAEHGGVVPVVSVTPRDLDDMRPALRTAAVAGRRILYLLSQPASGPPLAELHGLPRLVVFRPGCALEAAECWELALHADDRVSVIALDDDRPPLLRIDGGGNRCARGGYVLAEADGPRIATLIAAGPALAVAVAARACLARGGLAVAVVSVPCAELFARQDETYRRSVLGGVLRLEVEPGWQDAAWIAARLLDALGKAKPAPSPSQIRAPEA